MSTSTEIDLQAAVTSEFLALADVLDALPDAGWDTPSLCEGWRVREVVAHLTMPVRYSPEEFHAELADCGGDFTQLSNRVASRDAALPPDVLVGNLRDDAMHRWVPPGGGQMGALNHVVIHGLDVTVALGMPPHRPEATIRSVLDDLATGGTHAHFGVALTGLGLRATDIDWSFAHRRAGRPPGHRRGRLLPPTGAQPWGHRPRWRHRYGRGPAVDPTHTTGADSSDNAPIMSPAGRLHLPMSEWAKFVRLFFDQPERPLLSASSMATLTVVSPGSGPRRMAMGWVVPDDGRIALGAQGSNVRWVATALVGPQRRTAALIVCNDGRRKLLTRTGRFAMDLLTTI